MALTYFPCDFILPPYPPPINFLMEYKPNDQEYIGNNKKYRKHKYSELHKL